MICNNNTAIDSVVAGICDILKNIPDNLVVLGFSDIVSTKPVYIDINAILIDEAKKRNKEPKELDYLFYYINNTVKIVNFKSENNKKTNIIADSKDKFMENRSKIYNKLNNPDSSLYVFGHYKFDIGGDAFIDPNNYFNNRTHLDGTKNMIFYIFKCNIKGNLYFAKTPYAAKSLINTKQNPKPVAKSEAKQIIQEGFSTHLSVSDKATNNIKQKARTIYSNPNVFTEEENILISNAIGTITNKNIIKNEIAKELINQIAIDEPKKQNMFNTYVEMLKNNIYIIAVIILMMLFIYNNIKKHNIKHRFFII